MRDWLLGEARAVGDPNIILGGGLPHAARRGRSDRPDDQRGRAEARRARGQCPRLGVRQFRAGNISTRTSGAPTRAASGRSAEAHRLNDWVFSWLPDTPDDAYDIVAPLKAAGYTHHIAVPVVLPNGMRNGFTFATRAPNGFSDEDVAIAPLDLADAGGASGDAGAPARHARGHAHVCRRRAASSDPLRRCAARRSAAHSRRDAVRRHARFHRHHRPLSEEAATALVNQYYDCIVPAIDERGGEVLKFIGDGILAIFRAGENGDVEACVAGVRRGPRRSARGRAAQRHRPAARPASRSGSRSISATPPTAMSAPARGSTTP